jgi:hypothetical protein
MAALKSVWSRVWGIGGGVRGLVLMRGRRVRVGGEVSVVRGNGGGVMLGPVRVLGRGKGVPLKGRLGPRLLRGDAVMERDVTVRLARMAIYTHCHTIPQCTPRPLLSRLVLQSVLLSSSNYVSLCRNLCTFTMIVRSLLRIGLQDSQTLDETYSRSTTSTLGTTQTGASEWQNV